MFNFIAMAENDIGHLFEGDSDSEDDDHVEIKYDTYTCPSNGSELSLALVKKHHSLWGEFIYNAARVIADYIDLGKIPCRGKSVLELGAGAGLPGILAALQGSSHLVLSDYGSVVDGDLIRAMDLNIEAVKDKVPNCRMHSVPYIWGRDTDILTSCLNVDDSGGDGDDREESPLRFDIVIMADCIFNRSEHKRLLWTMMQTLDRHKGVCYCSFSHHDPEKCDLDLVFFQLALDEGLRVEKMGEEKRQSYPFVEQDGLDEKRGWVYVYKISFQEGEEAV